MGDKIESRRRLHLCKFVPDSPPARSSISEARPCSLEWQSCHALSYIVKPRIHTVFRPIEIVALPFPVYRFTLVMKFYH